MARVIVFSVIRKVFICHTENRLLPFIVHKFYWASFVVENKQCWHQVKREVQKVLCLMFCPPMAPEQWFSVPTCPPVLAHVCPGDIFSSHNLDQCQHLGGSRPPHSKLPKRGWQCQVNRLLGSESPAIDGVSSRLPSLPLSEPLSSHHT